MPDYGAEFADKAIDKLTRKIREVYRKAAIDLQDKFADFQKRHAKKGKEMFDKLTNGEITQAEYHTWMRNEVFIGKQWKNKVDSAVRMLDTANIQCAKIIRKDRMSVFAENYNYEAYKLEKQLRGVVNFNIYNERAVEKLIKKNPKMLPEWKIKERKDYAWNRQKVENAITQGIIQGKRIDDITDNLVDTLCTANDSKMRTFARTAVTGAQNAGRQAQMHDAEDMGIKVMKQWVATLDDRTRDTHQRLDGEKVPVDEPFEIDGMEIMFPGDPNAEAELVYNCRCTMVEVYEGIESKSVRRAYEDLDERDEDDPQYGKRNSYLVEDMTYTEWKKWKEGRKH